jgi:sigma-B regulation protein RsbU (phosphoserine phosphatase)
LGSETEKVPDIFSDTFSAHLFCTDGVTEARDPLGGLFGDARLLTLLQSCCGQTADEVARRILASIREYVGAAPQSDDITVTIVRFGPA